MLVCRRCSSFTVYKSLALLVPQVYNHQFTTISFFLAQDTGRESLLDFLAGPEDIEETIRKLDIQLTYLWKVHAVDFYAGKENADPMSFALRTSTERRIRGPRPEEGEQSADLQGQKSLRMLCLPFEGCMLTTSPNPLTSSLCPSILVYCYHLERYVKQQDRPMLSTFCAEELYRELRQLLKEGFYCNFIQDIAAFLGIKAERLVQLSLC